MKQPQTWPRDDAEAEERDCRAQAVIDETLGESVPNTLIRDILQDIKIPVESK